MFDAGVEAAIAVLMTNESLTIASRCMPSGSLAVLAQHVRKAVKR